MPNWSCMKGKSPHYRETVLPATVTARVAVEAGVRFRLE